MLDGRLVKSAIFALLLLPVAVAAPPATNLDTARSLDGQEVADLAMEPTGQFVAAVVTFDAAKSGPTSGLPGLPGTPTGQPHYDLYSCNFGPSTAPRSGTGCTGRNHTSASGALSTAQSVAAVSTTSGSGLAVRYAVAGPSGLISFWSQNDAQVKWSCNVPEPTAAGATSQIALNVSMPADAHRLAATSAPATGGGRLLIYDATQTCRLLWALNLTAAGVNARPTALHYARDGGVVAVGTDNGVLLYSPEIDAAPTGNPPIVSAGRRVSEVAMSDRGDVVVAGAANFVVMAPVSRVGTSITVPDATVYSDDLQANAGPIALTRDGQYFAAAAGSKIRFYHREPAVVATRDGTYDAGATVTDLAYDASGRLLVAIAGNQVIGFAAGRSTPLWSFDPTVANPPSIPASATLDGPLRKVAVSDDGQRIVVAGRTKIMPFSSIIGVTASLVAANGNTTMPPGSTLPLTLSVKNTGSLPDNYTFVVVPPVGWPQQSAEAIRLDPDQTGNVSLNLSAPAGQSSGTYGIEVRIRSQQLADRERRPDVFIAGAGFNVTIPRTVQLAIELPSERVLLRQGGEESVPVTIRNGGNEDGIVNLTIRQDLTRGASWPISFATEQVRVPAAGSVDVQLVVTAPADGASGDRNTITLVAKEGTNVTAESKLVAYVDAIFSMELTSSNVSYAFAPSEVRTIQVTVRNTGNTEDTYNLSTTLTPASASNEWSVTLNQPSVTVGRGENKVVSLVVRPRVAEPGEATLILSAKSQTSPSTPEQSFQMSLLAKEVARPSDDKGFLPAPPALWIPVLALAVALVLRTGGRR